VPIGIAAIVGGGSLLGGILNAGASQSAANTQAQAADQASQIQQQEFNQIQGNLAPYLSGGTAANNILLNMLGGAGGNPVNSALGYNPAQVFGQPPTLNSPTYNLPQFTQQQFQQSPGYQYTLGQAQNATRNAATPGQGTLSGATLKALQGNAAGLANQDWYQALGNYNQNYNNQYQAANQGTVQNFNAANQNYWGEVNAATNQQNSIFNMLNQLAGRGASTGVAQGNIGSTTAAQIGQNTIGAGNAISAGTLGSANAIGQSLQGVTNTLTAPSNTLNNSLLSQLLYGNANNVNQDYSGGSYGLDASFQ
jgi:hypothetical protein